MSDSSFTSSQLKSVPLSNNVRAGSTQRLQERHTEAIDAITVFKAQWLSSVGEFIALINQSGVNKRSYSYVVR
jgi:hypothetical protein